MKANLKGSVPSVRKSEDTIYTSKAGLEFSLNSDKWKLSEHVTIYVVKLGMAFSEELHTGLIKTLALYASDRSADTVRASVDALMHFARWMGPRCPISHWNVKDLQNYLTALISEFGHAAILADIRPLIKRWHKLRHEGVGSEVIEFLMKTRLKEPESGRAVRTGDPKTGPLDPVELHTLSRDLAFAFEKDRLDIAHFSLCIFHISTGRRPVQSSHLKCKDLDESRRTEAGVKQLLVHIPRVKNGGVFRSSFRCIDFAPALFSILRLQQRSTSQIFEKLLERYGWKLEERDLSFLSEELPLYPYWFRVEESLTELVLLAHSGSAGLALINLRTVCAGSRWHLPGLGVTKMLQNATKIAGTTNVRTGEPLSMSAYRFRYTKGTELAREGLGRDIIAWLLDHSRLDCVGVYQDNLPEHAIPANAAMALSPIMGELAQLFRGEVVDTEEAAIGGDDPRNSRIHFKSTPAASCSTKKQCGLGEERIPYCCYDGCESFQPWLEGPHLEVLEEILIERRRRQLTLGSDHRITRNADSLIVSVINVIQSCEARRHELTKLTSSICRGGVA